MSIQVINADMRDALRDLAAQGAQFHSCVTDPPYHLTSIVKRFSKAGSAPAQFGTDGAYARASKGFMGKAWDGGAIAFEPETWRAVFDVLLPGAHLLAFGGTRTYHRMACAIEDAGFEIRDQIGWMFGSGFPKSHDVSKGIDKAAGAERQVVGSKLGMPGYAEGRSPPNQIYGVGLQNGGGLDVTAPATSEAAQWAGWGTALKPAWEPCIVARKPLVGTVAANVLAHGTGALNIDACRIGTAENLNGGAYSGGKRQRDEYSSSDAVSGALPLSRLNRGIGEYKQPNGRWPANVIHDGSPEVEEAFAAFGESKSSGRSSARDTALGRMNDDGWQPKETVRAGHADSGSASRFFYTAKADKDDRAGSKHPTVKPTDLMRYLVRLVTPPGGTVLDPFAGSGSTGLAADQLGMNAVLIERDPEYAADIERKITSDAPLFAEVVTA